jgi:hypothetical protein
MTYRPRLDVPVLLGPDFPLPVTQPFTARQATDAGVSRHVVGRLVQEGLVRRILRGVYVAAQVREDLLLRARALALVVPPDAAVTDWSACWLHSGVLPPGGHLEVPPVSVFRSPGRGRLRNGISLSGERSFAKQDLTRVEELLVTTPVRTAWDLGRLATRDWALAGMDALLRGGGFDLPELVGGVERFRRQRGVVQLRKLAPLADGRSESPGESVLRLRWLDLADLPAPEPQVSITGAAGREIYRIDLGVEELRFGVEYDGVEHHTSDADRAHDLRRRYDLAVRRNWTVLPVTRENVFGSGRDVERILYEGVRRARLDLGRLRSSA